MEKREMLFRPAESEDVPFVASLVFDTDPSHFRRAFGRRARRYVSGLILLNSPLNIRHITVCEFRGQPVAIYALYSMNEMRQLASSKFGFGDFFTSLSRFRLLMEIRTLRKAMRMSVSSTQSYLGIISVERDFRNMGFARMIFNYLFETCQEIVLDVSRSNDRALSIYAKYGFETETRVPLDYPVKDSIRLKSTRKTTV
ncbi:MAG TPA: GNAT family N-acetyltransferase [Mesotoga infera]|uniref:GNAT family N-acetyltransferase n=1 Tax=Mesotoga infera TaxID=1236046 RepID=A0A7C1GYQ8_9BACT|nr:GNAT family N-acetyltransferase [Mesotoga infera]